MKKLIATLLLLILTLTALTSCGLISSIFDNNDESGKLRIGYMTGPTGMGMAKLVADNGGLDGESEKYSFTKYTDTTAAKADLAANKIDIICLPTNEAAQYFTDVDSTASVLAVNCLNSLYLLTDKSSDVSSLSDLEGQTIYTCKNGTPRLVLEYIIREAGINATVSFEQDGKVILTPKDLSALVISGKLPNAVMPEPLVTASLLNIAKNGNTDISYSVDVDLTDEWAKVCDTPVVMGCIVADGDTLADYKSEIDAFLAEYKASVEYIGNPENIDSAANYVVETGVMDAAPAAKKALTNLDGSIAYLDGADMKNALVAFYNAIGIALPADSFYYEK